MSSSNTDPLSQVKSNVELYKILQKAEVEVSWGGRKVAIDGVYYSVKDIAKKARDLFPKSDYLNNKDLRMEDIEGFEKYTEEELEKLEDSERKEIGYKVKNIYDTNLKETQFALLSKYKIEKLDSDYTKIKGLGFRFLNAVRSFFGWVKSGFVFNKSLFDATKRPTENEVPYLKQDLKKDLEEDLKKDLEDSKISIGTSNNISDLDEDDDESFIASRRVLDNILDLYKNDRKTLEQLKFSEITSGSIDDLLPYLKGKSDIISKSDLIQRLPEEKIIELINKLPDKIIPKSFDGDWIFPDLLQQRINTPKTLKACYDNIDKIVSVLSLEQGRFVSVLLTNMLEYPLEDNREALISCLDKLNDAKEKKQLEYFVDRETSSYPLEPASFAQNHPLLADPEILEKLKLLAPNRFSLFTISTEQE